MPARGQKPSTQTKYYPFNGGLDVVTPALSVDPGFALALVNYEPWFNGGYRRVDGYERFSGRPKPSAAIAYGLTISSLTGLPSLPYGTGTGLSGTGVSSHATAQFVESATVGGTSYLGLTNLSGAFTIGEKIVVGTATSTGTLTSAQSIAFAPLGTGTSGFAYQSEFLIQSQNFYRQQIQPVPGTGNVLGEWQNGTNIYAVRGTGTAGTPAQLYLASGTGWTTTGLTYTTNLYYTNLGTQGLPANGSVITGPGGTGTLYAGVSHNTTQGYLSLTSVTGTFASNDVLKATGTGFGTAASASSQFKLPTGGFYRWRNFNFFASSGTYNTYAVNGQGPAFQIDQNNVIMPILLPNNPLTGQPASNTPFLVEEYGNCLALAFPGGSFQLSVPGVPYQYNGFLGAAQFGVGAEITSLNSVVGPALAITTARNAQVLTGSPASPTTLNLALAAEHAGATLYSGSLLDTVYALNSLGITSLSRTQSYGNFVGSTVSQLVQPMVAALRNQFADSTIVRASNQARFYFTDGSVLIMYVPGLGQQNKAWSAIESGVTSQFGYATYNVPVFNICNSEDQNNTEVSYFSSSNGDGYVYQDRSGASWDGVVVTSYIRTAFNNCSSPAVRKYFRRADIELNALSPLALKFVADLSYSNAESSSAVTALTAANISPINIFGGGGYWDSVNWNNFVWDAQSISSARASLSGTGENISFLVFHQGITDAPFIVQGLVLHFDPRRLQR